MLMKKKYYVVKAKCGHVGISYYIPIEFSIKASSKTEAAKKARELPRVKHHHKDAILSVKEVSYEEFVSVYNTNHNDPYLLCKNIQEQNKVYDEIKYRLLVDNCNEKRNRRSKERKDIIDFKRKKEQLYLKDLLKYAYSSYAC